MCIADAELPQYMPRTRRATRRIDWQINTLRMAAIAAVQQRAENNWRIAGRKLHIKACQP